VGLDQIVSRRRRPDVANFNSLNARRHRRNLTLCRLRDPISEQSDEEAISAKPGFHLVMLAARHVIHFDFGGAFKARVLFQKCQMNVARRTVPLLGDH